jgi:hypothetical protein
MRGRRQGGLVATVIASRAWRRASARPSHLFVANALTAPVTSARPDNASAASPWPVPPAVLQADRTTQSVSTLRDAIWLSHQRMQMSKTLWNQRCSWSKDRTVLADWLNKENGFDFGTPADLRATHTRLKAEAFNALAGDLVAIRWWSLGAKPCRASTAVEGNGRPNHRRASHAGNQIRRPRFSYGRGTAPLR